MRELTDIKQIQDVLQGTLSYFADFCKKNELTFFLSNGSMLGAVKYQQFIPWDDDVDILMPRADYDKLIALADISSGPYRLLCRETVPGWRVPFAKLSDTRTLLKEGEFKFGTELGISLDIFPLDKWHPNLRTARWQARFQNILVRMMFGANAPHFKTNKRGVRKFILGCIWVAGHIIGSQRLCRWLERRTRRWSKYPDGHLGCVIWNCYGEKEVLPAEVFAKAQTIRFCGDDYPVPVGYDTYLTSLYGAWREELPPERQKSNHIIRAWRKDE